MCVCQCVFGRNVERHSELSILFPFGSVRTSHLQISILLQNLKEIKLSRFWVCGVCVNVSGRVCVSVRTWVCVCVRVHMWVSVCV